EAVGERGGDLRKFGSEGEADVDGGDVKKLRAPSEPYRRPPLVDGVIDPLVPVERKRLFGEVIDIVEHLQVRSRRVDHVERSNRVPGEVYVVVEDQAISGPRVDLRQLDVRLPLVLDVGDVVVKALVDQIAEPDEHPLAGRGP